MPLRLIFMGTPDFAVPTLLELVAHGHEIAAGDTIIGVASSGPHSNGFSLIRNVVRKLSLKKRYPPLDRPLGEALLQPTTLYVRPVLNLLRRYAIRGIAHITGGGFDNIPRILTPSLSAVVDRATWSPPPLFGLLQRWGKISDREMFRVFNMGIGLVLVTKPEAAAPVIRSLAAEGHTAWEIGKIRPRSGPRIKLV